MKHHEAKRIVAVLLASYPNREFGAETASAYVEGILDLDAATCGLAAQRLIRTSKFLPTISEIREATTAQQRGPAPRGEEAWAELQGACRRYGYDYGPDDARRRLRDPLFGAPHIDECLRLWGGWNAFSTTDHDAASRARFCALYDELAGRERRDLVSGIPLPPPAGLRLVAPAPVADTLGALCGVGRGQAAPAPKDAVTRQPEPPTKAAPALRVVRPEFQRRMTAEEITAALEQGAAQ